MRVYNGTNSQLDLPLSGIQRISIPPHAVSGDIMPSNDFLSLLVSSFNYDEIALIVSGPYEITMCAGVSGSVGFVVQSLEEAIERFAPKEEKKPEITIIEPKKEEEIKPVEDKDTVVSDIVPGIVEGEIEVTSTTVEDENPVTSEEEDVVVTKKVKNSKKK